MGVPRSLPEPGTRPYYFTWAAILSSGLRVPQYDDRGRTWALSATPDSFFENVVGVEVYVHPAFASGAPPVRLHARGRFEVAYTGRKDLVINGAPLPEYVKQQVQVSWGGMLLTATPDDFDPTSLPLPGWRFDVSLHGDIPNDTAVGPTPVEGEEKEG